MCASKEQEWICESKLRGEWYFWIASKIRGGLKRYFYLEKEREQEERSEIRALPCVISIRGLLCKHHSFRSTTALVVGSALVYGRMLVYESVEQVCQPCRPRTSPIRQSRFSFTPYTAASSLTRRQSMVWIRSINCGHPSCEDVLHCRCPSFTRFFLSLSSFCHWRHQMLFFTQADLL